MKNVLILGGSRFIGFHLTHALLKEGAKITHFRRNQTPLSRKLPDTVRLIAGDRNIPAELLRAFDQSYTHVFDLSGYRPTQLVPILEAQIPPIGHYLFCSTASVMQAPPRHFYNENDATIETIGDYGGNKRSMEKLLLEQKKFPVTIFRPQAVIGEYDGGAAQIIFTHLKHKNSLVLSEATKNTQMCFLDVQDLVRAFLLAANQPKAQGKIYALANAEPISLLKLVEECSKISQIPLFSEIQFGKDPNWWHTYDLIPDTSQIRADLSIQFLPLEYSLQKIWQDLRKPKWKKLWERLATHI